MCGLGAALNAASHLQCCPQACAEGPGQCRAFAAILADGSVVSWGYSDFGGDSSAVQAQLQNVLHVQASPTSTYAGGPFAAIREEGSVVTWGHPARGRDSSHVQGQLKGVQQIQATATPEP